MIPHDSWRRTTYQPGDVLAIDEQTPHVGVPNRSDVLRLSIDFRALPCSAPLPAIGQVITVDANSLTVLSQNGAEVRLAFDENTIVRGRSMRDKKPVAVADYLDKQAIVVHDSGMARLIRQPNGVRSPVNVGV
jgi:hypothetical protein